MTPRRAGCCSERPPSLKHGTRQRSARPSSSSGRTSARPRTFRSRARQRHRRRPTGQLSSSTLTESKEGHMDRATWLITGASSGLGYALAEYVLEQGDQVVAAARTLEPMAALTERYPEAGLALKLDVTDPQQRADAISQTEARFGAIDILVNNAGVDFIGAIDGPDSWQQYG